MFLFRIFEYFKLVKSLTQKRNSIKNWNKFVIERQCDTIIKKLFKNILSIKSNTIETEFKFNMCYVKTVKKFFKYPRIIGTFKVREYTVSFEVYNKITKNYKLEYMIFENGIVKSNGIGNFDEYFKKLKKDLID